MILIDKYYNCFNWKPNGIEIPLNQIAIYSFDGFGVTAGERAQRMLTLFLQLIVCPFRLRPVNCVFVCGVRRRNVFGRSVWPIEIDRRSREYMRTTIYFVYTAAIVDQIIIISWIISLLTLCQK